MRPGDSLSTSVDVARTRRGRFPAAIRAEFASAQIGGPERCILCDEWDPHMDSIVWGTSGALIGWLASHMRQPGDRQGVVALAGAALSVVAVHILRRGSPR